MCNACGFVCCAYDGFSGCGCDHCEEPDCWTEDDESEDDFDYDADHLAQIGARAFGFCRPACAAPPQQRGRG